VVVFLLAILMRVFPAKYGFFLNEFDPYYDFYSAQHIVTLVQQHGLFYALFNNPAGCTSAVLTSCHAQQGYFPWHDITTWFPFGRDVAPTSQDGLQFAGALLYLFFTSVFGLQVSLYDFLVLLPVFFGAITAVLFYFVVRRIAGEAAGLFAALMMAVSPPLIQRGNLGWFKSEPLAILLFVAASYLFLTLFDSELRPRQVVLRAAAAGFLIGYANTSWGGAEYFNVAFGLIFLVAPFLDIDLEHLATTSLIFTATSLFVSAIFPRPGIAIVTNPAGLALLGGTLFVLIAQWLKSWTKPTEYRTTLVKALLGFILAGVVVLSFGLVSNVSLRYLAAIVPWVRTGNPLVQSVAEHFVPTGGDYFSSYAILLFLSIFGAMMAFKKRNMAILYALIIGLTGLYVSAAFSRLLVYSSLAFSVLGGIGFSEMAFSLLKPVTVPLLKRKPVYSAKNEMRAIYSVALIALISIPATTYWIPNPNPCTTAGQILCNASPADSGVSLANGGTIFSRSQLNDWSQSLQWIKDNTPQNAVVIAWWDYGYWITVMGNRTSVADNATLNATRIAQIGRMFMSNATIAAKTAKVIAHGRPAYVLLFIVGSLIGTPDGKQYYTLQTFTGGGFTAGGGDESKKQWFIRIGGLNESFYLQCTKPSATCSTTDDFNLTPLTLSTTLFGQMLPFTFAGYLNDQGRIIPNYTPNTNGGPPLQVFSYPYHFQLSQGPNSLFRIAYFSPSLTGPSSATCQTVSQSGLSYCGSFYTILIYQVA
jgi:dolichyl-diphosphooligosaccharide--protein glycosyltransferase